MISNRLRLILFSSSFSALKHISTNISLKSFRFNISLPTPSCKQYSTRIELKKQMGQQNVFYFEESILLKTIEDANDADYLKLRETLPVVLLLGWTGGKDPHLRKYADFYSSMGYHTIRFSPSDYTTFLDEHTKYTFELLNLMKNDYKMTKNPILVQTFSNACGFVIYQHLINILNKVHDNKDIALSKEYAFFEQNQRGFIADSGFGWPANYFDLITGITNLIEPQVKFKPLRFMIAFSIVNTYSGYRLIHLGKDYFANAFETMKNDARVPNLYMYSKADKLISAREITKYIDDKRKLFPNLYIKSVVYEDADHVLIYAKYPEDYLKNIAFHISVCNLGVKKILSENKLLSPKIEDLLQKNNPINVKSRL